MKNSTMVMPHQVNQVTPMLAAEARVSMVRIAQTENSSRSALPEHAGEAPGRVALRSCEPRLTARWAWSMARVGVRVGGGVGVGDGDAAEAAGARPRTAACPPSSQNGSHSELYW